MSFAESLRQDVNSFIKAQAIKREQYGFLTADSRSNHEEILSGRVLFLPLFKKLTGGILNRYINRETAKIILEVGCGTGSFSRYLADSWLKEKLVSFDISPLSLQTFRENNEEANIFQGSIYKLPVKDESTDIIIGYSSFDSFIGLSEAIQESKRILKPGGKIILFQDLTTELYETNGTREDKIESIERYHKILVTEVKKAGLTILEGEDEDLVGVNKESIEETVSRVSDFEDPRVPLFGVWHAGARIVSTATTRKIIGLTPDEMRINIEKLSNNLCKDGLYEEMELKDGELASVLSMRFLVCEKTTK